MKIQYASDLHLEFEANSRYLCNNPLIPVGNILLLAGDIGDISEIESYPFWNWASEHFSQTLIVPGNHEFYNNDKLGEMHDGYVLQIRENIRLCYNAVITLDNIDFILSTLWGFISPEFRYVTQQNVADFERIKCNSHILHVERFNEEHEKAMRFLQDAVVRSRAEKRVVITHYLPTALCMAPQFKGNPTNGAFMSENFDFIFDSPVDYWIFGHSHWNMPAIDINGTKLLCNQLGYIAPGKHPRLSHDIYFNI